MVSRQKRLERFSRLMIWPAVLVRTLIGTLCQDALQDSYLCQGRYMSTHFSGIGTPEHSLRYLKKACAQHGLDCNLTPIACSDFNSHSVRVLLKTTDGCVFGNLLDRSSLSEARFQKLRNVDKRVQAVLRSGVRGRAWCHKHKRYCKFQDVDIDVSGSPCTAHSKMGKRAGAMHTNFQVLLTWAAFHIKRGTAVLVHENAVQDLKLEP